MQLRKWLRIEWIWLAVLLALLSLHFWFPRVGSGPIDDTYSTTAMGEKAFYLLVEEEYVFVGRNTDPLIRSLPYFSTASTVCLLGPARNPTPAEWETILEWVQNGGGLLYALDHDKPAVTLAEIGLEVKQTKKSVRDLFGADPSKSEKSPADKSTSEDASNDASAASAAAGTHGFSADVTLEAVQTSLTDVKDAGWLSNGEIVAPEWDTLVEAAGTVQAARRDYGDGRIVVVASDFIFSNQSLAWNDHANAVLAARLLEETGPSEDIWFDESLNASGTPKIVGVLLDPALRPLFVQLLIGLVLFGWRDSRRFGPIAPATVAVRHNIVDHSDAVGILLYRRANGAAVLRAYMQQLVFDLKLRYMKGHEDRVLAPIARRMNITTEQLREEFHGVRDLVQSGQVNRQTAAASIRRMALVRQAARQRGPTG